MFEDRFSLLADDAGKPIEELFQPCAGLEILEERFDGHPRTAEYPSAAHPFRVALPIRFTL